MKKLLSFLLACCVPFFAIACQEDSAPQSTEQGSPCSASSFPNRCEENTVVYCQDGKVERLECEGPEFYCDIDQGYADCVIECTDASAAGLFCDISEDVLFSVECVRGESGKLSGFFTEFDSYCDGTTLLTCSDGQPVEKACTSCEMDEEFIAGICK